MWILTCDFMLGTPFLSEIILHIDFPTKGRKATKLLQFATKSLKNTEVSHSNH